MRPLAGLAGLGPAWQDHVRARRAAEQRATASAQIASAQVASAQLERLRHRPPASDQACPPGLFARSVGAVFPVSDQGLAQIERPPPLPHPRQRELDEQAALRESMSDEVDLASLLLTDDGLSYRRSTISADVLVRLRSGHWALQGQLDLHGKNRDQAREALAEFLRQAQRRGLRCLRVVHGKGHGSPGREPVLKARVQRWLAQSIGVMAFAQASAAFGGAGALMVLLAGAAG